MLGPFFPSSNSFGLSTSRHNIVLNDSVFTAIPLISIWKLITCFLPLRKSSKIEEATAAAVESHIQAPAKILITPAR
jgi:hypothetical protein